MTALITKRYLSSLWLNMDVLKTCKLIYINTFDFLWQRRRTAKGRCVFFTFVLLLMVLLAAALKERSKFFGHYQISTLENSILPKYISSLCFEDAEDGGRCITCNLRIIPRLIFDGCKGSTRFASFFFTLISPTTDPSYPLDEGVAILQDTISIRVFFWFGVTYQILKVYLCRGLAVKILILTHHIKKDKVKLEPMLKTKQGDCKRVFRKGA